MNTRLQRRCKWALKEAFTLLELLIGIAIVAMLSVLAMSGYDRFKHNAKRTKCIANLRTLASADILYYGDHGQFPPVEGIVPSSIRTERLAKMGEYVNMPVPDGAAKSWPKRTQQPDWSNCPMAKDSGYAEGLTAGGGVYTGYMYVGGIEDSQMVQGGMANLRFPEHSVDSRNMRRGVLWCDVLGEFRGAGERRFECFHSQRGKRHPDFRFPESEIVGINRAWSDGSVEWIPVQDLELSNSSSKSLQIEHFMGNYFY